MYEGLINNQYLRLVNTMKKAQKAAITLKCDPDRLSNKKKILQKQLFQGYH